MKTLMAALSGLFGRGQRKAVSRKTQNVNPTFSTRVPTQVETQIAASGPDFAFAYLVPDCDEEPPRRIYVPASARITGGTWWEVRRGRRVRLDVVQDWHGRGLRALGLTFLDTADSAA